MAVVGGRVLMEHGDVRAVSYLASVRKSILAMLYGNYSGDTTRSVYRAYHMNLSTCDMARVGYLMLREGEWVGRQVIPRDWARTISRAYTGLGAVGQHITVLPALDLVVAHKTRPGQGNRSVSHPEYLQVLDRIVKARCPDGACAR